MEICPWSLLLVPLIFLMGGGLDDDDGDPSKGELSFDAPFETGLSVIVLSSLDGVCCGSVGTSGAKMCFRERSDAVSCPVSHTRNKAITDLPESTLYRVDGGASSTTLLLDPCLLTTGIGAADLQVIMTTPFTEEEWANKVLTFEGAEVSQTHIHEFRKTVSFERHNLAIPQSIRKKIAENRGKKVPGLDKLADHKQTEGYCC